MVLLIKVTSLSDRLWKFLLGKLLSTKDTIMWEAIENNLENISGRTAFDAAKKGDTVILSPASTSFDRFKNFEERGNHFRKLAMKICYGKE